MLLEGFIPYKKEDTEKYTKFRWWLGITFGDLLDKATDLYPDKEALVDDRSRLTYSQLREKANRLAIGLMKLGIESGDPVLLQLPNWAEYAYSYFALHKIGAIAVLLLPRHTQLEINHLCSLVKAKAWIVPEKYRKVDYLPIIDEVLRTNPELKHVITVRSEDSQRFIRLEKLIEEAELSKENLRQLAARRPEPTEVAYILPTGGTTGLPKAAPRTHNDAICEAEYKSRARENTSNDVCLITIPLEHNLGLAALNGAIFNYGKLVLLDSTRIEDFCATVQREKVTCGPIVPTQAIRLVNFEGLKNYDLSSLKKLYSGGEKTSPEVIKGIFDKLGCTCIIAFGMAEGPQCSTRLNDDLDTVLNTAGRPSCPYEEYKVIDHNERELPRNTEGELVAKGPGIFTGYLKNPGENKKAFTQNGFFRTGDLAIIDDRGYVRITGRIKDIIIRGGENISPIEIENLVSQHPDVEDVAVVGMPDKELGERACAYIKPRAGAKPTLEGIVSFLKSKGASVIQLPERVELIDNIPLTKIGKADKKALREDLKKRLGLTSGN